MAKNQTFSVSLSLLTKNFQKGVKTVQASLNSLKMQFRNFAAAMGAGLGISEIARNMIDSAKKLDKAQAVLKNVSNGIEGYAENQQFVMNLSKKYNQELTTLLGNYAKFHSAANMAGMALEDQQYIYESLTRAAAYYNLTADETNGVMLAINQMISKGKVSSEELRRQLGERLPGAMELAAKAMGVTTAELDKMIRNGEVMATDLLPKLAAELNKVTGDINVDHVQGAIARLQNSFTALVQKLNISQIYKNVLNGISSGLEYIGNNLRQLGQTIAMVLGTIALKPMIEKGKNAWNTFFNDLEKNITITQKKIDTLRDKSMVLSKAQRIKIDPNTLQPVGPPPVDPKALNAYTRLKTLADEYGDQQKILTVQQEQLNSKIKTMGSRILVSIKNVLKMAGIQALYYGIAMAISAIVTKLVSWYREQKRIKNLVADTRKDFEETSRALGVDDVELTKMSELIKQEGTLALSESERLKVLNRINTLLGLQGKQAFTLASSNNDINKAIEDRLDLMKKEREYQAALQIAADAQSKKDVLNLKLTKEREKYNSFMDDIKNNPNSKYIDAYTNELTNEGASKKIGYENNIKSFETEIRELGKVIQEYDEIIKQLGKSAQERKDVIAGNTPDDTGGGEQNSLAEDYKKIQEEYNQNLRTLNEMRDNELIAGEDYNKALEDLTLKTAESILALNDIDETTDEFAKGILDAAKAYIANAEKEDKMQDALDEYYQSVRELYNQYNNGVITQEQLDEEMMQLLESTVKAIAAMGDLSGASQKLADEFNKRKRDKANKAAGEIANPVSGVRDATFDYNKTDSEILGEVADIYREYEDKLKETIKELEGLDPTDEIVKRLEELNIELDKTIANAETMEEAMNLAKVSEDIKDLKKELNQGVWENFTGIADAADRLTRAVEDVIETMEDPDTTAWEKILSIFNAITQVTDTILQSIEMITTLTEVMDKLKAAEASYQAIQAAGTAQTVAGAATTVVAKQAEATASGTAEAAKMPFPYNLLAIAGVVGMIASVFASLPKFAGGGIVQGNSTIGDHNLARVNAGEMILNKQQQATLFNLLNGSNGGALGNGGGNVEFKIKGSELVGVLKNHNNRLKG